jgi:predicted membrane channel-forming protein YqfA (hemolysin III family)
MIIYVAHMISAFYHISNLLPHQEILLQKMDFIGANFYVASSYWPMTIALFPTEVGTTLLTMSAGVLGWNVRCIIHSRYGMHQPIYLILLQLLFSPFIYTYFTTEELILNCTGIISLSAGAYFLFQIDPRHYVNKERKLFTQFDTYHAFSVICLTTTCLMNYSIFKRTYLLE